MKDKSSLFHATESREKSFFNSKCLRVIQCKITTKEADKFERRWTIIALRSLIFYFWSNIELTWHECSFMSQITNYKEKIKKKNCGT